jgi:hypothetical protein
VDRYFYNTYIMFNTWNCRLIFLFLRLQVYLSHTHRELSSRSLWLLLSSLCFVFSARIGNRVMRNEKREKVAIWFIETFPVSSMFLFLSICCMFLFFFSCLDYISFLFSSPSPVSSSSFFFPFVFQSFVCLPIGKRTLFL